jgi:general secretion pathway protein N
MTMDWAKRNPLAALLALVVAVLVAAIAAEALLENRISGPAAASARKPSGAQAKLLPPLTIASAEHDYPETADRPLFIPTRRPAPVVEGAGQQRFQKGQFALAGVISAGSLRIAMLKEKTNGHIHRVEQGKDVNGIIVERIEPEAVTLALGGDREVLSLAVQKGPATGPNTPHAAGMFVPAPEVNPAAAPPAAGFPVPGQPFVPPGVAPGTQPGNPLARSAPAGQLTPEELLARRRARRGIPAQPQPQPQ